MQINRDAMTNLYRDEAAKWFAEMFELPITGENLFEYLMDGVLLCKLAAKVVTGEVAWRGLNTPTSSPEKVRPGEMAMPTETGKLPANLPRAPRSINPRGHKAIARDNCHKFIEWCKKMGLPEEVLFESEDLVGCSDRAVNVLTCLLDVARMSHNVPVPEMIAKERSIQQSERQLLEDELRAEEEEKLRKIAEEEARVEAARLAEEARIEAERLAEEARVEAERVAEEARIEAEEARIEAERVAAEEARLAAEEAERQRIAEEARLKQEEEERKRKAAEEAARLAEEERVRLEEEARILAQRQAEELEAQRVLEERRRLAEEARLKAEEEMRKAEEERARVEEERRKIEEERLRAEEEYKLRKAAEEAAVRRAEEEERRRLAEEETARLRAEAARIEAERKALEEEVRREQEHLLKLQQEKAAAQKARAEAQAKREADRLAAEEAARVAAEEEARVKAEEECLRAEAEEAARIAAEEDARRKAKEDACLEAARRAAEDEARRAAEEAERLRQLAEIEAALAAEIKAEQEALAEARSEDLQMAASTEAEVARLKQEREDAVAQKTAEEEAALAAAQLDLQAKTEALAREADEATRRAEEQEQAYTAFEEQQRRLAEEAEAHRVQQAAALDKWKAEKEEKRKILLENLEREKGEAIAAYEQDAAEAASKAKAAQDKATKAKERRKKEEKSLASKKKNKDELDGEVQKLMKKVEATVELVRLRSGTYLIKGTTKKIFVRILNSIIMVRVGGGWEKLEVWLKKHKPQLDSKSRSEAKRRLDARIEAPIAGGETTNFIAGSEDKVVTKSGKTVVRKVAAGSAEAKPSRKASGDVGDVLLVGTGGEAPDVDAFSRQKEKFDARQLAQASVDEQARIVAAMRAEEEELLKQVDAMSQMEATSVEDLEAQILKASQQRIGQLDDLANKDLALIQENANIAEQQFVSQQAEIEQKGQALKDALAAAREQSLAEAEQRQTLAAEISHLDQAKKEAIASLETSSLEEVKATVAQLEATRLQREQEHKECLARIQQEFRDRRAALETQKQALMQPLGNEASMEVAPEGMVCTEMGAIHDPASSNAGEGGAVSPPLGTTIGLNNSAPVLEPNPPNATAAPAAAAGGDSVGANAPESSALGVTEAASTTTADAAVPPPPVVSPEATSLEGSASGGLAADAAVDDANDSDEELDFTDGGRDSVEVTQASAQVDAAAKDADDEAATSTLDTTAELAERAEDDTASVQGSLLPSSPSKEDTAAASFQLGKRVETKLGPGEIKWVGHADFLQRGTEREWCGVMLDDHHDQCNNGSFQGIRGCVRRAACCLPPLHSFPCAQNCCLLLLLQQRCHTNLCTGWPHRHPIL